MSLIKFVDTIKKDKAAIYNLNTGLVNAEQGYLIPVEGLRKSCSLSSVASSVATYIKENGFELSLPDRVILAEIRNDSLVLNTYTNLDLLCEVRKIHLSNRQVVIYDVKGDVFTMPNSDK